MSPRKRTRSEAFANEPEDVVDAMKPEEDAAEKKQRVWDSFREQHHEAVEILPLTLHRQYRLLRELNQQAEGYSNALLPTARAYIAQRLALKGRLPSNTTNTLDPVSIAQAAAETPSTPLPLSQPPLQLETLPQRMLATPKARRPPLARTATPMTPATPIALPPERTKEPKTSKELLSHIAWLSDELLQNSLEKVELARSCCDLVDRQIRLVDQAIRDQEAVIALELRPGTHPAPIVLADIAPPQKFIRTTRRGVSPLPGFEDPEQLAAQTSPVVDEPVEFQVPEAQQGKRGKKSKKSRSSSSMTPVLEQKKGIILKIPSRAPALVPPLKTEEEEADDGRLYCLCHEIQGGRPMISCDGERCVEQDQWFHWDCVGVTEDPPDGQNWYCPSCSQEPKRGPTKSTRTRTRKRKKT